MREILKQAITVALYIDELQNSRDWNEHDIPRKHMRMAKRVFNKFLRLMKQQGYHTVTDKWGETYYNRIESHIDRNTPTISGYDESTATKLTYVQMQFHDFLRKYLPKTIGTGNYSRRVKNVSFYKSTLEMLMRE